MEAKDTVDLMRNSGQGVQGSMARLAYSLHVLGVLSLSAMPAFASPVEGAPTAGAAALQETAAEPSEASLWLRRAEELSGQGAQRAAFDMLLDRGRQWLGSERISDALLVLEAATALQPGSPEGWALLGRAHTRNRDFDAAQEALEEAVKRGDGSARTLIFLGGVLWENGDLAAAESRYEGALAAGGSGIALAQLGRLMLWQGRYVEAAEILTSALGAGSSAPDVLFDRAEALRGAGRTEEAIEAYRQVNRVAPTLFKAYYGLAVALGQAGRTEESREEFTRYETLYREDQERTRVQERNKGEVERARALLEAEETDAALAHLATLPESADVLALIARGQWMAGRTAEALATLERAVGLDPRRSDLRRLLSEMRMAPAGDDG